MSGLMANSQRQSSRVIEERFVENANSMGRLLNNLLPELRMTESVIDDFIRLNSNLNQSHTHSENTTNRPLLEMLSQDPRANLIPRSDGAGRSGRYDRIDDNLTSLLDLPNLGFLHPARGRQRQRLRETNFPILSQSRSAQENLGLEYPNRGHILEDCIRKEYTTDIFFAIFGVFSIYDIFSKPSNQHKS